ncbi:MAG: bifunctional sulfate adenylyltransferase/adenylylsulfate kinase [Thermodesulfobacteriota bacterium]|nr:bifunctional sulfate adenylyltransferase/adenylylsulfate kinase [Thermodesulfobacteriota bacterium]
MSNTEINKPHGGSLVNLLVDEKRQTMLKDVAFNLSDITLDDRQLCNLELLTTGAFSPLNGFMTRADYESVLDRMRLQNGVLWPIPICLDISETKAKSIEAGQSVTLRDAEGFLLAIMEIEEIWPVEVEKEARQIFGTSDRLHPGVQQLYKKSGNFYIGGTLDVLSLPLHFDFKQLRLTPLEIRNIYQRMGWKRVVGFQTSQPVHRPQYELTLKAMQQAKANLLLLPIAGMTKPGDFDHYTRVRCYREVTRHYPPDSFILNLLPVTMRMAGPREALWQAIIAKNYGCTHFIVGHDHAGPGRNKNGKPFYKSSDSKKLTKAYSTEIDIEIISFNEMVYLPFEDEYRFADQVPQGSKTVSLTGSDIRERILTGREIPKWATFSEVVDELRKAHPLPHKQGFTVFLTGLSGAGKSTIAKVLYSRFLEIGDRPVSLLDGDIVRRNLSSNLKFTKEDRDINVRRIGFVASEITKNRGIAICAPIAPYESTRSEIRSTIECYGGFIEVHVSTPIEICEKRDRKGMYAKARAGLIKGFTGVDDPYEIPTSPELSINTIDITPNEAAQEILLFLGQKGFI